MTDPIDQAGRIGRAAARFRNVVRGQLENAGADLGGMNQIEARIDEAEESARRALQSGQRRGDGA